MYVTEVAQLFREYTNEYDKTYLKDTQLQRYLRSGYDEFRRVVANYDPNVFSASVTINPTNSLRYDLSTGTTRILGSNPNFPSMQRLTKVLSVNTANNGYKWSYTGVKDEEELMQGYTTPVYMLVGNELVFSRPTTDTIKIIYVPAGSKPRNPNGVDWTKSAPADTEFIDDLDEFHDMIALYAYAQYAAREASDNVQVEKLLGRRIGSLQQYLFNGRDHTGNSGHTY